MNLLIRFSLATLYPSTSTSNAGIASERKDLVIGDRVHSGATAKIELINYFRLG
jgi:hypothetical protein